MGRRGVIVEGADVLWTKRTRTKRGARRTFLDLYDRLVMNPGLVLARPGADLIVIRVERSQVVEKRELHVPDDQSPDAGVREPRRPRPSAGGAAAAVDAPF